MELIENKHLSYKEANMYKVNPCLDEVILNKNNGCSICDTIVHDVTHKTEEEVLQLFKQNNNKLCVQTSKHRLNTPYYLHPFKRFAFAVILVFGCSLFTLSTFAQDSIVIIQRQLKEIDTLDLNTSDLIITGVISDELGDRLPFVSVSYLDTSNTTFGCVSDFNGRYRLAIKNSSLAQDSITMNISYVGYKTKNITISTKKPQQNKVIMNINYTKKDELFIRETIGIYVAPRIDNSPDGLRKTTFKRDEIDRHNRP